MAQPQMKTFNSDAPEVRDAVSAAAALANTPFGFWSNMAEMQRQYLSNLKSAAGEKADVAANANTPEAMPEAGQSALAPAQISRNWMATATECQRELASFVNERLTKNQAFFASAAAAPGPSELLQLHAGWMNQTAQDYVSEFEKLSCIVRNGVDEAVATTA